MTKDDTSAERPPESSPVEPAPVADAVPAPVPDAAPVPVPVPDAAPAPVPAPAPAPTAAAAPAPVRRAPPTPDRAVRASELRAAARTPAEIADALAREARVRKKRAALKVARGPLPGVAKPAVAPPAPTTAPIPPPLVAHAPPAAPVPAPAPAAALQPAPSAPSAPAPSAPALAAPPPRVPSTPRVAVTPHPPQPPAPPPPTRVPARAVRSRPPYLIASVLLVQGLALAYLAVSMARLGSALERAPAAATTEAPRAAMPAPTAAPTAPSSSQPVVLPAIAPLGEGRLVYATPDGKLVLLDRDRVSGELRVERVYSLEKDELKNMGDDARRAYSGYYLVDVERVRRESVGVQEQLFNDASVKAAERPDGLARCVEIARLLADAGGVDRLRRRLDDRNNFARHAAAIALGERGYYVAIPGLIQIAEGTGDTELARRVVLLLRDLTGLPLEPDADRAAVARRADDWWKKNQPEDPYARRLPPPR